MTKLDEKYTGKSRNVDEDLVLVAMSFLRRALGRQIVTIGGRSLFPLYQVDACRTVAPRLHSLSRLTVFSYTIILVLCSSGQKRLLL